MNTDEAGVSERGVKEPLEARLFKVGILGVLMMMVMSGWWGQALGQQAGPDQHSQRIGEVTSAVLRNRHALVIGNSAYQQSLALANGRNDAIAVGNALEKLGFRVSFGLDTDLNTMRQLVGRFSRDLQPGDIALFYYAGHGTQANGANYLIPVDAVLNRAADLPLETERLDDVIGAMTVEDNTAIILLDACRDNPFLKILSRPQQTRTVDAGRGLAPVDAGNGVYIAFATQPGNVALDGHGVHSPFTTALLNHIATPAIDIEIMMRRVRLDVMNATDHQQVPWSNSSLVEPGFAFHPEPEDAKAGRASAANDREFWVSIKDTSDPKMYRAYLAAFPTGAFVEIAKSRVAKLEKPKSPKQKSATGAKKLRTNSLAKSQSDKAIGTARSSAQNAEIAQERPAGSSASGSRCRDGDINKCRQACAKGKKRACNMLRVLEKSD